MFRVRIHGRCGQASMALAGLLADAATRDGWSAEAAQRFGPLHEVQPAVTYCQLHDGPTRPLEAVLEPDAVIISDETLLYEVEVLAGLRPDGFVLLNSPSTWRQLNLAERVAYLPPDRALSVPADRLARPRLGTVSSSAAMLGGFAAASGLISFDAVAAAISKRVVTRAAADHVETARDAYVFVLAEMRRLAPAMA